MNDDEIADLDARTILGPLADLPAVVDQWEAWIPPNPTAPEPYR